MKSSPKKPASKTDGAKSASKSVPPKAAAKPLAPQSSAKSPPSKAKAADPSKSSKTAAIKPAATKAVSAKTASSSKTPAAGKTTAKASPSKSANNASTLSKSAPANSMSPKPATGKPSSAPSKSSATPSKSSAKGAAANATTKSSSLTDKTSKGSGTKPAPSKPASSKAPLSKAPLVKAQPSKAAAIKPATAKTPTSKTVATPSKENQLASSKSKPLAPVAKGKSEKSAGLSSPEHTAKEPAKSAKSGKVEGNGASLKNPVSPPPKPKAPSPPPPPHKPNNPKVAAKIREMQASRELRKDLSQDIVVGATLPHGASDINHDPDRDRLALVVRDSFWLHASWEVTRRSVDRARAAMADQWHTVHPILRVVKIDNSGTTANSETIHRDIEIHGGVRNWYIDVSEPPSTFRVLLGYAAGNGRFYELIRSNIVTTPIPGSDESVSTHWADIAKDAERIFALSGGYTDERETKDLQGMFEDHLKRPMGAPALAQFGSGAESGIRRHRHFHFELDAEMIVFGSTHPDAYVTLGGEPVKVQTDGTFSVRVPLPDRRQVLPACACTRDGVDEQTIVIAVERNTKVMEPLSKESEDSQG